MVLAKASVVFSRNLCTSGSLFGPYNSSHSSTEGSFPPSPRKVSGGGCELSVPLSMVELLMLITSVWEPEKLRRPGGGVVGGETKNERRNGSGGKGKMPTGINCLMAVVVNDDLWISSMAVIYNADHWEFFIFNSRRCERRPLNFTKGRRSQRWSLPRVLYGNSIFQIKNPNSNAGLKNITELVRFKTGSNGRRCERWPLV